MPDAKKRIQRSIIKHLKMKKDVWMTSKKGKEQGRDEWNEKTVRVSSMSE